MAKIKYSALVQEMRNKLNGSVMSKNRYGNYVRNKTTPVNPQTSFQQNQRARLSSVSQAWAGLTASARSAFAALAENHPFVDIFGDQRKLDGKAMFSKLSLNRLSAGQTILTSAPVLTGVPFLAITQVDAAFEVGVGTTVSIAFDEQTVPVGFTLIVQATPALPATIGFVKNRYRELGTAAIVTGDANVSVIYADRFGDLSAADAGKFVHVRAFLVDTATGQVGIASEGSAEVISI